MADLQLVTVTTPPQMQQALDVRRRVFIEEQGVPEALEVDEHDAHPAFVTTALHVLVLSQGVPVATGRLLVAHNDDRHAHIGRVAVLAPERGRGYGRAVMLALHEAARRKGVRKITLGAQLHAIGFYETLGYAARGDVFLDAGIEHRWMDVRLYFGDVDVNVC